MRYFTATKKQYINFWIKVSLLKCLINYIKVYESKKFAFCEYLRYLQLFGNVGARNIHNGTHSCFSKVCKKFLPYDVQAGMPWAVKVCEREWGW